MKIGPSVGPDSKTTPIGCEFGAARSAITSAKRNMPKTAALARSIPPKAVFDWLNLPWNIEPLPYRGPGWHHGQGARSRATCQRKPLPIVAIVLSEDPSVNEMSGMRRDERGCRRDAHS